MKILHIGEYVKGGVATYLRTLLDFQYKNKEINEVYLLLSKNNSEKKWPIPNKNILYYEYRRNLFFILKAAFIMYKSIKSIEPDIIHVHSTWAGVLVRSIYFLQSRRPKIIYCAHGWSFLMESSTSKKRIYAYIERLLTFRTDMIVNISKYEHEQALKVGIPESKCVMIYNGIKEVTYNISNEKTLISMSKGKINLLYVGRFDKQKGIDILIELFNNYKFDNIELYLIGDAVLSDKTIIIPKGVHQLGWIENNSIDQYYSLCDAVIMPSRWEGFGLVAVEAMKNKKAVIASNRGALPEIVINNYNGYIFDITKKEELYDVLIKLDKTQLNKMGINGYSLYKQKFTDEFLNNSILNLYLKVLS